jgi:hypothetical protein
LECGIAHIHIANSGGQTLFLQSPPCHFAENGSPFCDEPLDFASFHRTEPVFIPTVTKLFKYRPKLSIGLLGPFRIYEIIDSCPDAHSGHLGKRRRFEDDGVRAVYHGTDLIVVVISTTGKPSRLHNRIGFIVSPQVHAVAWWRPARSGLKKFDDIF